MTLAWELLVASGVQDLPPSTSLAALAPTSNRIRGIDAARGAAMLLVCLAHFAYVYFTAPGSPAMGTLYAVTLVASPTFMLISGMMLGLLIEQRGSAFPATAATLRSRGIFLLTVGHALIVLSCIPRSGLADSLTRGFITDDVGVAIIVGPWLLPRLGTGARLGLAVTLYVAGMWLGWGWNPATGTADVVDYVLGGPDVGDQRVNFPLLSWLALYVLGSVVGERLAAHGKHAYGAGAAREMAVWGAASVTAALAIKVGYVALREAGVVANGETSAYALTSIFQKFPPSLPYHLLYGGTGLLVTAGVLWVARRRHFRRALEALATLGRASLFVFLLQFYVYYVGFHYLALPYSPWWPVAFAASLVPIWLSAAGWLAIDGNRFFDVRRWFARSAALPLIAPPTSPMPAPLGPTAEAPAHSTP